MEKIKLPTNQNSDFDEYAARETNKIREDLEFYEMVKMMGGKDKPITNKIVQDNLAKIIAWHEDYLYCKNCPGIDKCQKETPHMQMNLKFDGLMVHRYFDPCNKLLESINQSVKYLYVDFPDEWKNNSISNIDLDGDRKNAVQRLAEMMNSGDKSLYLYGKSGVGKSYVAAALANDFIRKKDGIQIAFISTLDHFKTLQDYAFNNKEMFNRDLLNLSSVALLVLDGFGNEYKSDYVRDTILIPLISERIKKKLPTIFTSNFKISEIVEMYSLSKAGYIRAKQLGDLLRETCDKEIELTAHLY
jgi:primosomal protein DnaI